MADQCKVKINGTILSIRFNQTFLLSVEVCWRCDRILKGTKNATITNTCSCGGSTAQRVTKDDRTRAIEQMAKKARTDQSFF
jgi:hypothetical protein